ncbi:hypothetical protein ScPMuIL_004020, partial [Solemya velum]
NLIWTLPTIELIGRPGRGLLFCQNRMSAPEAPISCSSSRALSTLYISFLFSTGPMFFMCIFFP